MPSLSPAHWLLGLLDHSASVQVVPTVNAEQASRSYTHPSYTPGMVGWRPC